MTLVDYPAVALSSFERTTSQKLIYHNGGVAQLGEHLPCKQGVRSSILLISTNAQGEL